jgi:hypothetical protein
LWKVRAMYWMVPQIVLIHSAADPCFLEFNRLAQTRVFLNYETSGQLRTLTSRSRSHTTKTDMAHPGVDHLRLPGSGTIAEAVVWRAQVRAALDDLAWNAKLRSPQVLALLR